MCSHSLKENSIYLGDCIKLMEQLPRDSVDMIFADPPYNLSLSTKVLYRPDFTVVNSVKDVWDQFASFAEYDAFTLAWLQASQRVLKPSGTLWVIGTYHNIFRVGKILQDLGFWILNDIIWHKINPMPNFYGTRFTNAHETLIWCCKNKEAKYKFNYQIAKNINDQEQQMRSDWWLPICKGKERIYLNSLSQKKILAHNTQKPEALLQRILLTCTDKGDLILDPFLGSGTTAVVAKILDRRFICFEKEAKYVSLAQERLAKTKKLAEHLLPKNLAYELRKIKFGFLVENQVLPVGGWVTDSKRQYQAQIMADGMLKHSTMIGTIHGLASKLVNHPTNGWLFWFLLSDDGKLTSINDFRITFMQFINNK